MDVIYPYKATPGDFDLRYSLRSLVHVPHDRVIVAGDKPGLDGVLHVPVGRDGNRYASSTANIVAAAEQASDRFIVMHDDIFLLRPWRFSHEDRGTIDEYLASGGAEGTYRGHAIATRDLLRSLGFDDPLWFGLHTPTVYERDKLLDLVKEFRGKAYLLRTMYHNLHPQPSIRRDDVKVRKWTKDAGRQDVLSISDVVSHDRGFRRFIQERFPEPSPYERVIA